MIYIDGILIPILTDANEDAYRIFAEKAMPIFKDHGGTPVVHGWADDVPHGKSTDCYRAVQANGEPIPIDGPRMIFGGFCAIVDQ